MKGKNVDVQNNPVEEGNDSVMDGLVEALNMEKQSNIHTPVSVEAPKPAVQEPKYPSYDTPAPKEPINCLRNERIIIRFVPKANAIRDKHHVLFGGMAETATCSFVVPVLSSTGVYKNILTKNEKDFLEQALGFEKDALSIYRKDNNFWDDSNPNGIGRVTLRKQDNILDLNNPVDYIKYKILLNNSDYIAPSMEALETNPKATYKFVILSEEDSVKNNVGKFDTIQKCYMAFGKIESDSDTLRCILEMLEGRPINTNTKPEILKGKINEWIQKNPKTFLAIVSDELLSLKVLVRKCIDVGLIGKKNDTYYLKEDNSPLCNLGETSTLNNAAKYLGSIKNQTLKLSLETKVKQLLKE